MSNGIDFAKLTNPKHQQHLSRYLTPRKTGPGTQSNIQKNFKSEYMFLLKCNGVDDTFGNQWFQSQKDKGLKLIQIRDFLSYLITNVDEYRNEVKMGRGVCVRYTFCVFLSYYQNQLSSILSSLGIYNKTADTPTTAEIAYDRAYEEMNEKGVATAAVNLANSLGTTVLTAYLVNYKTVMLAVDKNVIPDPKFAEHLDSQAVFFDIFETF
ncbi:hypothetical protein TVAG_186710 [Trichomonas vaginalis G3]|uniref:Uncharacterized protein n=1 Tax=Trichomonas vaginalis (strain ATCC PRA-98 / G3) TaxID=412133 RepID=A2FQB1_TRIV3|nr:hypothetical protein TVAGG3_0687470 [Trichomonas vaginalis G3]EAX92901.1 hypothetical protein TVAG_186710 [Trichomonas vaginalis G3]KAI5508322.1 hypothetical protein TVAGG3_0687470 [Trichomonas vaginalis G3]|eukprot:XP_001305831.1 hypothetical protein [Trichomonas vaginalis G3]